jgi:osmotically-inducible protein OsmY
MRPNAMPLQLSPSIHSSTLDHAIAGRRSDRDIATDVVACLRSGLPRVSRGIVPIIKMGEVSLLGCIESDLQRLDARQAVQRVRGVGNVIDLMVSRPGTQARAIRLRRGE